MVILGGTGVVGRLAVQAATLLGAGSITVVGRDESALDATRELGATATVAVGDKSVDELSSAIRHASSGADVVVDYTWGTVALAALRAGNRLVRLVQVGDRAGAEVALPAQLLRSIDAARYPGAAAPDFCMLTTSPTAHGEVRRHSTTWSCCAANTTERCTTDISSSKPSAINASRFAIPREPRSSTLPRCRETPTKSGDSSAVSHPTPSFRTGVAKASTSATRPMS